MTTVAAPALRVGFSFIALAIVADGTRRIGAPAPLWASPAMTSGIHPPPGRFAIPLRHLASDVQLRRSNLIFETADYDCIERRRSATIMAHGKPCTAARTRKEVVSSVAGRDCVS